VHQNQNQVMIDGVLMNDMFQNMSTDNNNNVPVCANCGKEGANNICNKCKQVKYCNAACKKKHRTKHKKACDRRVAELYDQELFKQPPPKEDCPICFLLLPTLQTGVQYMTCCGKVICCGCIYSPVYDNQGNEVDNDKCPFCRTPNPASMEEVIKREKKRFEVDDPIAIYNLGCEYDNGTNGHPQDYTKALEFWHRAADLGYADSYNNIGYAYNQGEGVEVDEEKARYYYELAAMGGNATARYNLGLEGEMTDNFDRALKHYLIAVRSGVSQSLQRVKSLYSDGYATKEDTQKHYNPIKNTWVRLRVAKGMKLLQLTRSIVTIDTDSR